jgi:hypothetical protein
MLFLLEYDRAVAKTVACIEYDESERSAAQAERLKRELAVNRAKVDHEVVLLQAPSLAALRKTHARYFDDIETMIARLERTAKSVGAKTDR